MTSIPIRGVLPKLIYFREKTFFPKPIWVYVKFKKGYRKSRHPFGLLMAFYIESGVSDVG